MMPDISITIVNDSQDDQKIVIYQNPPADSVTLPAAWAVFNLDGAGERAQIVFPDSYQVAAGPVWGEGVGEPSSIMPAELGTSWRYTSRDGCLELSQTGQEHPNQISIVNDSHTEAWLGLAKMDRPYIIAEHIADNMAAIFQPRDTIVIGVGPASEPGTLIRGKASNSAAVEINLDGAQTVEAVLVKNGVDLEWQVKVNGHPIGSVTGG